MAEPTVATWEGIDVDTTVLESRMSQLFSEISNRDSYSGAMRTHIFNLVVYAADAQMFDHVQRSLQGLAHRHPSRAIILCSDRFNPRPSVDASIRVYCHEPAGIAPLCHEQVLINAHGRAADHLANIVIPLLVAELRSYLWWPGQPPFGHRMFHRMLAVTDQLVVDSAEFASPGDGFANLARLCGRQQGVNDFNWARLRPWRDVITQFFDGPQWAPYAENIRSIRLEFGRRGDPSIVTSSALLLLGWLAQGLHWEPETTLDNLVTEDVTLAALHGERVIPVDIQFHDHGADSTARLMAVEVVSQPRGDQPARFTVRRTDDLEHACVCTAVHDGPEITRVVSLDLRTDPELLADELDLVGHDFLYERVVDMASRMAGREVWLTA